MKKPNWINWLKDKKECEYFLKQYLKKKIIKKSNDESKLFLKKTNHNLTLANYLLKKHDKEIPILFGEENFYDWIISCYYYSIYHVASALMSKELFSSKNHSATLCFLIYYHYHDSKKLNEEEVNLIASSLSEEDIETIGFSKELREKANYDVHESFEKQLVEQIREETINFVNKIKEMLY